MKKIISFLKTDIKIINSYFLFAVIFIILISIGYTSYALFSFTKTSNNVIEATVGKIEKKPNAPVLASNMIPVYYDETTETWKKADLANPNNTYKWYNYNNGMWANAVTVTSSSRSKYLNASIGTAISMNDITTMWVWIPRFNAARTVDFTP
ncbi:unknown [Mycoplasma sp. CAG:611]|nr:unknown [Mycoplasma sp. CAG:611]